MKVWHNYKTLTFLLLKKESLVLENTRYGVSDQAFLLCDHWRNIVFFYETQNSYDTIDKLQS